ncbi:Glycosyltransferase [hydrothermal vent metagenome]|uniref:Glycosyltransferase n=1 Tax=hydrothermal vent metagenome TaxID=652676 RepID=A0A3B1DUX6_9ZZZZ
MPADFPRVTICIPHWEVFDYIRACLRSIRKHSKKYNLEVIVVDNGSQDESIDYLRSLDWIRLIERPEERHTNWPNNVFTAWDRGYKEATGEYFITMHSDVFVKTDCWLDPLFREMNRSDNIGASGAWKLDLEHPLYKWQKQIIGFATAQIKSLLGRKRNVQWKQGHYPRDYCAMYRRDILMENQLTFLNAHGAGGSLRIAQQIWDCGYQMGMVPAIEMAENVFHVAHGTAAVRTEKKLNHNRAQKKVERKVTNLFEEPWIQELLAETSLDAPQSNVA